MNIIETDGRTVADSTHAPEVASLARAKLEKLVADGTARTGPIIERIMLVCNQEGCSAPAVGRFTWPGHDEAGICAAHLPKLRAVATALGLPLQVIPVQA